MEMTTIVIVFFAVVAITLGFMFIKKAMKIAFSIVTIISLLILFSVVYLYFDIASLNNDWSTQDKILLLDDDGVLTAGYTMKDDDEIISDLDTYQDAFDKEDFEALNNNFYKIIIVDINTLDEKPQIQSEDNQGKRGELFKSVLKSKIKNKPLYILEEYDNGNIAVYPETITFKLIKLLPFSMISSQFKGDANA